MLADTRESLNVITSRITKSKGPSTALMRVSYLALDIISDILAGRRPVELTSKRVLRTSQNLPLDWTEHRKFLRFSKAVALEFPRKFPNRPLRNAPTETLPATSSKTAEVLVSGGDG